MGLKSRLKRLERKTQGDGIMLRLQDGTVRVFDAMEIQQQMFLAKMALFRDKLVHNEVLGAVRNATPESRSEFEGRFGAITMTQHVIAAKSRGGWVESYTLTEAGNVERIRYEGDSEEARRVREGARSGTPLSDEEISLPRPPVAGRWSDEPIEDFSEP